MGMMGLQECTIIAHARMADPGFANGGPRSSAAGASIEAPKAPRGWGLSLIHI